MAIDELTDEAFFDLYNDTKKPKIKELVDGIQKKYNAHISQKGQSGYDEGNIDWYNEAKSAVSELDAKQQGLEAKTSDVSGGAFSGRGLYAAGLILAVALLASAGLPYIP